ncbi:PTS system Galactitol-specific IIC component [Coriobacterium glomerans PW2]|uniref:PTS system Galactitol-specific IIC component n=1 Tax=Coriobacterium glomerans (strain ATCC 49209 / DSM 20642 / JCM 10262 / PW2) TaxID=700015 RepID=F2NBB4_CORGP|nr:PTS transporter subunit IIC [Coriobacterium glomerans]AEB06650.1 PTS system Galactitol-specific IIC component [Coriobacterium glomerans PW2]
MDVLLNFVNYILAFGAAVFVPLIMLAVGLLVRMKPSDAFIAALTLGVAFTGMNVLINFMTTAVTPAAQGLAEKTGVVLNTVDVGWPAMSAIAWAWPLGVLCFPLMIGINIIMLSAKLTNTLNVDLWNTWTKLFTAVLTYYLAKGAGFTDGASIGVGFAAAAIQVVIELKLGDMWAPTVEKITGIPNVTVPHCMTFTAIVLLPIELLLEKIPALENSSLDAKWLRSKIGIFGENAVMGLIIGFVLGIVAYADLQKALTLAVQAATAMQLFPMVSKLFSQALSPISEYVGEFMRKRFRGRDLYIGLDWPITAGSNELWVTTVLLIPFELVWAIALVPVGNTVLPFASILNLSVGVSVLFLAGGNLVKMLIMGVVATPIYLMVSTSFAPYATQLARQFSPSALAGIGDSATIAYATMEAPVFRWAAANGFSGNIIAGLVLVMFIGLFFLFCRVFKHRNKKINEQLHGSVEVASA